MIQATLLRLQKSKTDEAFFREALINIAKSKDTPEDVFDARFESVKTEQRQYVYGYGSAEIDYTCAVGYKKRERYKQYNSITKKMETKTKEWVDWTPMSGSYSNTSHAYIKNDATKQFDDEIKDLEKILNDPSVTDEVSLDTKKATVSDSNEGNLYGSIASSVASRCRKSLPGDELKDFHYTYSSDIDDTRAYDVPTCVLEYNYRGENYASYGFAIENMQISGTHPEDMQTDKARREQKEKPFVLASLGVSLLSSIVSLFCTVFIISLLCFIGAAGIAIYTWVRWNNTLKSYRIQTQRKKIEALNEYFKRLGIKELTQSEKDMIEGGAIK